MQLPDLVSMLVFLAVFLAICGLGVLLFFKLSPDTKRTLSRLRELADETETKKADLLASGASKPVTIAGHYTPLATRLSQLLHPSEAKTLALRLRMHRAGIFRSNFSQVFTGTKILLFVSLPLLVAWVPYGSGFLSLRWTIALTLVAAAAGVMLPDFWLRHVTRGRQRELRRALPDTLDMLVLCLEGGESLVAALQRVTEEVNIVYSLLGEEMNILQREIQLGLTAGQALKKFGERCGLAEVRDLASVLLQSERHGASIGKALRTHADAWRLERQQQAEEHAQKTSVKILFPTLLCIFPAIFVVLLGPAAHQLAGLFTR